MRSKVTKKKIKTPIKIVQDVDDKYFLNYQTVGKIIDIAFNEENQKNKDYEAEGKTYLGRFLVNDYVYDISIHVFKKYLEVKLTPFDAMKEEKKNGK